MPEQIETSRLLLRKPHLDDGTTDVKNTASRRVLEKAEMQCEGILRKYIIQPNLSEIARDSYIYAITK